MIVMMIWHSSIRKVRGVALLGKELGPPARITLTWALDSWFGVVYFMEADGR